MLRNFGKILGRLPRKETIDFVKNVAFLAGLNALSMSVVYHKDAETSWFEWPLAILIGIVTGATAALSSLLYMESWETAPPRVHHSMVATTVAVVLAAGLYTKWKLVGHL
ncbi:hypothetical protein GCM10009552_15790 [Rothia nasimurium]|uniref:Uncharacterized protein n=1 Tax=Luteibacter anthropi TaxID=564369 RepID=A0A7X5UB19_9GAMM|nr:hypothetical protein [Luteibacter anthropi]NII07241.1 hypothetical protein [Luteibacter anthropi]